MNRYITRGIANNLPNILQHQLWQLVSEREQERPEYAKIHKANYSKAININKVYIIREDDVDLSYYVMLLPEEY